MREVSLVGKADTRVYAPKTGEVWGLNESCFELPYFSKCFQIHDDFRKYAFHIKELQKCKKPIIMRDKFNDIPMSEKLPLDDLVKKYGEMFSSTMDYMMATAIEEGFEKISLYGMDMVIGSEYSYQRPTFLYFIGLARGQGIQVWIHPDSGLNKRSLYAFRGSLQEEEDLYRRIKKLEALINNLDKDIAYTEGFEQSLREQMLRPNINFSEAIYRSVKSKEKLSAMRDKLYDDRRDVISMLSELKGFEIDIMD